LQLQLDMFPSPTDLYLVHNQVLLMAQMLVQPDRDTSAVLTTGNPLSHEYYFASILI